jgi:hypothetical protein
MLAAEYLSRKSRNYTVAGPSLKGQSHQILGYILASGK